MIKNILKLIGTYILYLLLTIIIFKITGMYSWSTPPTRLVLLRMLIFPILLTILSIIFIKLIKYLRNKYIIKIEKK